MVVEELFTDENLRIRFSLDRLELAELCLRGFDSVGKTSICFAGRMLGCGSFLKSRQPSGRSEAGGKTGGYFGGQREIAREQKKSWGY